ncbi:MAG: hypothetical protein U5O39_07960 [Gammaproteobacteria bacterium]|nr:hypothetical protein [Gammaproteobacteria bacterium]
MDDLQDATAIGQHFTQGVEFGSAGVTTRHRLQFLVHVDEAG